MIQTAFLVDILYFSGGVVHGKKRTMSLLVGRAMVKLKKFFVTVQPGLKYIVKIKKKFFKKI